MKYAFPPSRRGNGLARLRPALAASVVLAFVVAGQVRAAEDPKGPGGPAGPELRIGKLRVGKILFLGNSVTRHPPAPDLGWLGDWGMAASAREKDFVHLLVDRIAEEAGGKPDVMALNIADFERHPAEYDPGTALEEALEFRPDLVVLAIGANVPALTTDEAKAGFHGGCAGLLGRLKREGNPTLLVRGEFWSDPVKDGLMREACREAGGLYVDLGNPAGDEANLARSERRFEHAGVAGHPGDRGMRVIADALWKAVQERGKTVD